MVGGGCEAVLNDWNVEFARREEEDVLTENDIDEDASFAVGNGEKTQKLPDFSTPLPSYFTDFPELPLLSPAATRSNLAAASKSPSASSFSLAAAQSKAATPPCSSLRLPAEWTAQAAKLQAASGFSSSSPLTHAPPAVSTPPVSPTGPPCSFPASAAALAKVTAHAPSFPASSPTTAAATAAEASRSHSSSTASPASPPGSPLLQTPPARPFGASPFLSSAMEKTKLASAAASSSPFEWRRRSSHGVLSEEMSLIEAS